MVFRFPMLVIPASEVHHVELRQDNGFDWDIYVVDTSGGSHRALMKASLDAADALLDKYAKVAGQMRGDAAIVDDADKHSVVRLCPEAAQVEGGEA